MTAQFSFELFPPKTEAGVEKLRHTVTELNAVNPAYFSVTYGAGGSTRERSFSTVFELVDQGIETAPHLSCIASKKSELRDVLQQYKDKDIKRLVALRGDLPSGAGMGGLGDFQYANELVQFVREEFGDWFHIEVAAYPEVHPQADNFNSDLKHFKMKVEAGANAAITQYFYTIESYFYFIDACERVGIEIPIVPGIMPITNYTQLARFSDACGAEIPRWIRKRLESYGDDIESIRSFGLDVVCDLTEDLLSNDVPGIHFYTMNQSKATLEIWNRLGLSER